MATESLPFNLAGKSGPRGCRNYRGVVWLKTWIFLGLRPAEWDLQIEETWRKGCMGFPVGSDGKEHACQCRKCRFDPWVGKIPLEILALPGESHEQRSLAGCSPWGLKESDMT